MADGKLAEQQLDCALDLMRRLPPQNIEENLTGLIDLVSDREEDGGWRTG
jgi:capping protein (actin filament) muscle Z-line, beta